MFIGKILNDLGSMKCLCKITRVKQNKKIKP